ncbi:MAG TPA: glycosyltransferase family 4 protein [Methylomirabilota bacterium]
MRILLLSPHKRNFDTDPVFPQLDQGLRRLGHRVTLLTEEDLVGSNTPAILKKLVTPLLAKRRALQAAMDSDVVEAAGGLGWSLFSSLRAQSPTRPRPLLVTRLHGLEYLDEQARFIEEIAGSIRLSAKYKLLTRRWINWQEFRSLRLSDCVVCHTSRDADGVVTRGLKGEHAVATMPLATESRYFRDHAYSQAASRILWWGSWIERKGISTVPRALELLTRSVPEVTITMGGTGAPPEVVLSAFPAELRARVTVLPFVSRERHLEILDEHDVFLFPSLSEGFGLALAEAMASSLPCVTTLTGLAHDWLEHGRNCLVVPMCSPTGVARAVERLLSDVKLRGSLGTSARATAENWSWDRFARETATVYERQLSILRQGS